MSDRSSPLRSASPPDPDEFEDQTRDAPSAAVPSSPAANAPSTSDDTDDEGRERESGTSDSDNCKITYERKSNLQNRLKVSFRHPKARQRAAVMKNNAPIRHLFRNHDEKKATLSKYVSQDQHIGHPDEPLLQLVNGNSFQAIGTLKLNTEITKERIERAFNTPMKAEPTSLIAFWNTLLDARSAASRRFHKSKLVPRRGFVSEVDISHAMPATLSADMETAERWYFENELTPMKFKSDTRFVEIPIYVLDENPYEGEAIDRPDTTLGEIVTSGSMVWLSVAELMKSDLGVAASNRQQNVWFAVGSVPEWCITRVMPYDGHRLYTHKGQEVVQVTHNTETYLWDFDLSMWEHVPHMTDFRPYRLEQLGDKRRQEDEEDLQVVGLIFHFLKQKRRRLAGDDA
ncbi:hypothetical protein ACN47E_007490 [Coniothyrium glycines]